MTKEELEKEAEEYLAEHSEYSEVFEETFVAVDTLTAMVDFAEPREKRIAELEQKIKSLEGNSSLHEGILWNDIHNHDKKIAELEAQIEKMKCCSNCMWSDCDGKLGNPPCKYCDFNSKWELRR